MPSIIALQFKYLAFNLRADMAYRFSFFLQTFGMVLNNGCFIIFWLLFLDTVGGELGGYAFSDIMFLWSAASAGFGIAVVCRGNMFSLSSLIHSGDLDVYLLQPRPVRWNALSSKMIISGLGDLLYGVSLFLITTAITARITPLNLGLFVLFSLLAALLHVSAFTFYHSLSFFLGNAESVARLAGEAMVSFTLYPGAVFKGPERFVLSTVIPAAWAAYIPLEIFRSPSLGRIALVLAVDAAIFLISAGFFHLGLRRYESGSRIGSRI